PEPGLRAASIGAADENSVVLGSADSERAVVLIDSPKTLVRTPGCGNEHGHGGDAPPIWPMLTGNCEPVCHVSTPPLEAPQLLRSLNEEGRSGSRCGPVFLTKRCLLERYDALRPAQ